MPILDANTAQLTVHYTGPYFASGGGATVLGFRSGSTITGIDLTNLTLRAAEAWSTSMNGVTSDHVTCSRITAVTDTLGAETSVGVAGEVTADNLPPSVAGLVNHYTARRGRRGRGRAFLPGVVFDSNVNDFGIIDEAVRSAIQNEWISFLEETEGSVGDWEQVVLQGEDGASPPISPAPVVTERIVSGLVSTQRGRLRR